MVVGGRSSTAFRPVKIISGTIIIEKSTLDAFIHKPHVQFIICAGLFLFVFLDVLGG